MIKTDDLVRYLREHAIGRSITVPNGWIRGSDLEQLARMVLEKEPFDCMLPAEKQE